MKATKAEKDMENVKGRDSDGRDFQIHGWLI